MTKQDPIIIGCDHAGYELKEHIKRTLTQLKIIFKDIGAFTKEPSDYSIYISEVASAVSSGEFTRGIAIDGMGMGASMVANRFPRVYASHCLNSDMAQVARSHNNSNILVMGGRITSPWYADQILKQWLEMKFEGGRHAKRLSLIDDNTKLQIALNHLDSIEPKDFSAAGVDEQLFHKATKGIERLKQLFTADRRMTHETRLPESCPSSFFHNGMRYEALMVDLSESGAQFQLDTGSHKISLVSDEELEFSIKTPYGHSTCKGKVVWVDRSFYLTWGIKFTELSPDKNDPLKSLMDSM